MRDDNRVLSIFIFPSSIFFFLTLLVIQYPISNKRKKQKKKNGFGCLGIRSSLRKRDVCMNALSR